MDDKKEYSEQDANLIVAPYQTRLRRRCVALGFQRLTHEGEQSYVDMFDGGRAANPNPFHEKDLAEWRNGKRLGKMNASEVHVWELTRIADLPEQPGIAESQFSEEEEAADANKGGRGSIVKSPRDSVVGNSDLEKRDEPQKRAEKSSPGRDGMKALPFNRRDSVRDLGPVSGVSPNLTPSMQELLPKQSNLRDSQSHDPGYRHDSPPHHAGMENRGYKRRLSSEAEDANTQVPQCYRCCGLGQNCSGEVRCKVCTAAGVEVCTYRYCSNGLGCRDPRCVYVHPRQVQDDPRWTIQEGSLPEKGALVRANRQIPICTRCWRRNHWCDSTKRCQPCQKAGVRCVYKACAWGISCRMKVCNYMHPNQYDADEPNWSVEPADIGIMRSKLENGAPLPRPPGQTNEFAHRKSVCKHCSTTGALCDSDDKCEKCCKEGVECVRVLCEKGKDCKNLQCRAAHPGQFGCRAILEKKVVPFNPPKAPSRWFELYRR